jgi:molybdenum cofactor biosynthesis enzyme MoaA
VSGVCAPISRRLPAMRNFIRPTVFASVTARSSPLARSRSLGLPRFRALVDDAVREGFTELYVTGGKPFLERDLVEMLLYATERLEVVCLTNAMPIVLQNFTAGAADQSAVVVSAALRAGNDGCPSC